MNFTNDSQEKIVIAQLAYLLKKYSPRILQENGDGNNLLRCAGLSCFVESYSYKLDPYEFNGRYKNDSCHYNPGLAFSEILLEIESDKAAFGRLLNEFFKRLKFIEDKDVQAFSNYLEIVGYSLLVEDESECHIEQYSYTLIPSSNGIVERQEDISYLLTKLNGNMPELVHYYEEAISTFGNSEYKSCIGNCRSLFEKVFQSYDADGNEYHKGILNVTSEKIIENGAELKSINKIFKYWLDNKKGANRFRLFVMLYSLMSGLGTHGEETPSKEDALLSLRATEDVLIWSFRNQ